MNQRILNNKYAIHSVVGKGGMAIVYKGEDIETKDVVAVKILKDEYLDNKEFVAMFEKEAVISKQIKHNNVVNTFEVGVENGSPYMVMEYVQGRTLKEYITMKGILTEEEAVNIAVQICDAMIYAHDKKLVHRDIKSQNILIEKDGTVKVADFGIAKMTTSATMTMSGSNVLGSVHYMSPEQAMGNVVDKTTDIYSLGIVMYEMLTGTLPFKGDTPVIIAMKHVNEGISSPMTKNHSLSSSIDKIIIKAANKSKDLRYQTAEELKNDLLLSIDDPYGDFVTAMDVEGDTKAIPIVSKEMSAGKSEQADTNELNQESTTDRKITEIGLFEDKRDREEQERILHGIAVSRIRKVVIGIVLFIAAVIAGLSIFLIISNKGATEENINKFLVPNVGGMLVDEATKTIKESGFNYTIEYVTNDDFAEDVVISQSPKPDQMVDNSVYIKIKVSLGPELFIVPNVVNVSFTDAIAIIEEIGFLVGDVSQEVSDLPEEYVVRQEPKAGTEIPAGEKINIWIAIQQDTTIPIMPNVVGRKLEEAIYLIDSVGVDIDRIEVVPIDSGYEKDIIIYHEPETDAVIDDEDSIVLYVSNGEEEKYSIEKHFLLSLNNETTKIRIVYVAEGIKQVIYDKSLTKGDHDITLTLYTNTPGEKDIIIYYDGVEIRQDRVVFEVQD